MVIIYIAIICLLYSYYLGISPYKLLPKAYPTNGCFNKNYYKGADRMSGVAHGAGTGFSLLVVLFILLVIIGASWYGTGHPVGGYGFY